MSATEHRLAPPALAEVRPGPAQHTIGVFVGERCLHTWHTMADDYAYTHATAYAAAVNAGRLPGLNRTSND